MTDFENITLKDLTSESLKTAGKNTIPEQANEVLTYILYKLGATDFAHTKSTSDVVGKYEVFKKQEPEIVKLTKETIATYLSILAKQDYSLINCPGRKQGYYLSASSLPEAETKTNTTKKQNSISKKTLEKVFYPYLENWLRAEGYAVKRNIANKHVMKNAWQNPDILGIKRIETLDEIKIEVATIEVKRDASNWHQDIFEAVAHKVLSNRVYFAFGRNSDQKDLKEMIEYAMYYRIGLLAIVTQESDIDKAILNKENSDDFNFLSNVDTEIIVPAPYDETLQLPLLRKEFLKEMGIKSKDDYWKLEIDNAKEK